MSGQLQTENPCDVCSPFRRPRGRRHPASRPLFDSADGAWPICIRQSRSPTKHPRRRGRTRRRPRDPRIDLVGSCRTSGWGSARGSSAGGAWRQCQLRARVGRRGLVEAAGLGRFKRRRHRAELKLARRQRQVATRARDLRRVKKRLRPLAPQATAARRAGKLGTEPHGSPRPLDPPGLAGAVRSAACAPGGPAASGSGAQLPSWWPLGNGQSATHAAGPRLARRRALARVEQQRIAVRREAATLLAASLRGGARRRCLARSARRRASKTRAHRAAAAQRAAAELTGRARAEGQWARVAAGRPRGRWPASSTSCSAAHRGRRVDGWGRDALLALRGATGVSGCAKSRPAPSRRAGVRARGAERRGDGRAARARSAPPTKLTLGPAPPP